MESEELIDEIEAIDVIFPNCLSKIKPSLYHIKVPQNEDISFDLSFPLKYPETKPRIETIKSAVPGLQDIRYFRSRLESLLDQVFVEQNVCLFEFISEVNNTVEELEAEWDERNQHLKENSEPPEDETDVRISAISSQLQSTAINSSSSNGTVVKQENDNDHLKGWFISEPVVDRKSTFIGYSRAVHSEKEVFEYINELKMDRKIAKSNHVMTAYRIQADNGVRYKDCDDDGETAAGSRLLHLLDIIDAWNVVVVVVRWFGGLHIGPDRFKHINSTAREALVKGNLVEDNKKKTKKKKC
ncbi:BA75_04996T0 [Komagataella pastoris]|uniref:BA75_04996T0 n=1 Tax=Komagataella pastoris TaxID=4922 RepID=A0A1B2JHY8_PICPA|nr:BA75_04996T0 [Komagataella pastoris]